MRAFDGIAFALIGPVLVDFMLDDAEGIGRLSACM
jgi:hypothetical protein